MSDETETVEAGSETSGDTAAETTATEQSETAETTATDAGAAAEETSTEAGSETSGDTAADESRTGYADKGLRAGDQCICPDGRTGTVHSFDAGLICIPNADQGE
jgi:hypothetical protein